MGEMERGQEENVRLMIQPFCLVLCLGVLLVGYRFLWCCKTWLRTKSMNGIVLYYSFSVLGDSQVFIFPLRAATSISPSSWQERHSSSQSSEARVPELSLVSCCVVTSG